MSDPMAEIRASFFVECEELLESLNDGLLAMEDGASDSETINVVFRAVHSIKGGAGAFALDDLVKFAHHFETAMDEVRSGRYIPKSDAIRLFFACSDMLGDLVRAARDDEAVDEALIAPILTSLEDLIGAPSDDDEETLDFTPATLALDLNLDLTLDTAPETAPPASLALAPLGHPSPDNDRPSELNGKNEAPKGFSITFKPDKSLYASGNEPLYLFRALRDLGDVAVICHTDEIPALGSLDPNVGHLSWTIEILTDDTAEAVREVFDFVDGLCVLEISPLCAETTGAELLVEPSSAPSATADSERNSGIATSGPSELAPQSDPIAPQPEYDPIPDTLGQNGVQGSPSKSAGLSPSPTTNEQKPKSAPTQPRATVRVDLERIDRLVNLVGELVINQAMLSQSVAEANLPTNSTVSTGLEEFLQLTRDIQESVMMIRAQPIKSLFQRMGRIVRETSSAVGKDVRLHTSGENTEVDKTVIERLADPLTHMIRNAVDHGLESAEDRLRAGKPATGHVTLSAQHRSGRIVIEISDDGAGLDRDRIREKAIEKGLIGPDTPLSEADMDAILFMPGFSTASEISNLSGRGVGMDVVKSSIQALGGRITIRSTQGQGTTFSISLPLTLAVLDGMVVRVSGETLVVPLNAILETLTLTDGDLKELGPETHVVQIRGGFVPLLDLGAELGYRQPLQSYIGGTVLLIGQEDGSHAAVAVDAIEDQRQVVIKGLEGSYGRVPGIAAATILGDGQIALILDPADLVAHASGRTRNRPTSIALAG